MFLTPPQAAKLLRISPAKIYGWITSGGLSASNVGNSNRPQWRIAESDLQDFLKSRSNRAEAVEVSDEI